MHRDGGQRCSLSGRPQVAWIEILEAESQTAHNDMGLSPRQLLEVPRTSDDQRCQVSSVGSCLIAYSSINSVGLVKVVGGGNKFDRITKDNWLA